MTELDRVIHEPVRLRIMCLLSGVDNADFKFLLGALGVSTGNLSSHLDKLETAGFIDIEKSFNGKVPRTLVTLTDKGRTSLDHHWASLDEIRRTSVGDSK